MGAMFKKRSGRRKKFANAFNSGIEVDNLLYQPSGTTNKETRVVVNYESGVAPGLTKKMDLHKETYLLSDSVLSSDPESMAVLAGGIFINSAHNPHCFPIEIELKLEGVLEASIILEARSTCKNVVFLSAPKPNAPKSPEWCREFGIICRQNLESGIIERREDGLLVVWRTFRYDKQRLTPFALYCNKHREAWSEASVMLIDQTEFDQLLKCAKGFQIKHAVLYARPVLDRDSDNINDAGPNVILNLNCPVIISPPLSDTALLPRFAREHVNDIDDDDDDDDHLIDVSDMMTNTHV